MIYSSHKAAHHLDRLKALREGKLIYPTQVQIDLTNECNHRCPFCFYRCAKNDRLNALFNEKDVIPTEHVLKLLKEFKKVGIPAVQFTGGGEPFMHPGITEILQKTLDLGLELAVVTNGAKVKPEHLEMLARSVWVRFSVDASTPQIYAASQHSTEEDFHHVIATIKDLVSRRKGSSVIGMSFVISPINYKQIESFADMAKDLGVDNIRYSVAYTPRGIDLYRDIWEEIKNRCYRTRRIQTEKFKVFDLAEDHLCNLDMRDKGYDFCGYQHFTAVIGADGCVYPCCTLKYNAAMTSFGNIKEQSFKDIWNGEKRAKWMKMDHLKYVCDKNPCWMDSKNKMISYLIKNNPPHVNYI